MKNKSFRSRGVSLLVLALVALAAAGCAKEKRPDGMPEIYSCQIKLTQNGAPLEGATLIAYSEDPTLARWPITGLTDARGVAQLQTYGNFKGAPKGSFTLLVSKEEVVDEEPVEKMEGEATRGKSTVFSLVDPALGDAKTSTLKIQVEPKGDNSFEFDAGEAVRIEKKTGVV